MADLYAIAKRMGLNVDNHASDLYIEATPSAQGLIKSFQQKYSVNLNVTFFQSQLDHKYWIEVPFYYSPFWSARGSTTNAK
jgi:hypothetical protein